MRYLLLLLVIGLAGCMSPAAMKINQGLEAANQGDLITAEALTREALQLGPDHADRAMAINNLGTYAARRGDVAAAIRAWTFSARLGGPIAQQNLLAYGAPIPPADLAPQVAAGGGGDLDSALLLFLAGQQGGTCTHQTVGSFGVTDC